MYRGYPPAFWVLWWGTLLNRLGEFVVPLLGFYLAAQHLSVSQVSLVLGTLGVGRFVAEGLSGQLIDRYGAVFAMQLALAGGGVTLVLLAHAQGYAALLVGTTLYSLLSALYKPAANTTVAELTQGPQRARAYNLLYWAVNVGASVAPVLGGVLAGYSFRLVLYLDALTMFIYSALLLRLRVPARLPAAGRPSLLPRDPLLWWFCVASLLYTLTYQSYKLLALVFVQQGFSAAQYGQLLALNGVLVVALGLPIGHWLSTRATPVYMSVGAALLALGFALHSVAHTLPMHALAVVVWTLGEIVEYGVSKTLISELGPPELRGTYIGLVGSMSGLATLFAPLLGGFVLEHAGAQAMWLTVAACALVAAGLFVGMWGAVALRQA